MFQHAGEMPSPRRHFVQNVIDSNPQDKQGPVEAGGASGELSPSRIREITEDLAWELDTRVSYETVVVENERIVQRRTVSREGGEYDCGGRDPKREWRQKLLLAGRRRCSVIRRVLTVPVL